MNGQADCVVRRTANGPGRHPTVAPRWPARQLHVARIVGTAVSGPVEFQTGVRETGLVCLKGRAFVLAADELYELTPFDALYVPAGTDVRVDADGMGCDLVEVGAPFEGGPPVEQVCYAELPGSPGGSATLIGGTAVGRIAAGVSFGGPCPTWDARWERFEKAYLMLSGPGEGWPLHLMCRGVENPEALTVVREGDCVLLPAGCCARMGSPAGYVWLMAKSA